MPMRESAPIGDESVLDLLKELKAICINIQAKQEIHGAVLSDHRVFMDSIRNMVPSSAAKVSTEKSAENFAFGSTATFSCIPSTAHEAASPKSRRYNRTLESFRKYESYSGLKPRVRSRASLKQPCGILRFQINESIITAVILMNLLWVGLTEDFVPDGITAWKLIDVGFLIIFWVEIALRFRGVGVEQYFRSMQNVFDVCITVLDTIQLILEITIQFRAQFARIIRVLRFARMFRALRFSRKASDLIALGQGLVSGARTLGAALIFSLLFVYLAALLCRYTLGYSAAEEVRQHFDTIFQSGLTLSRCFFGDCSSKNGNPLIEVILKAQDISYKFCWGVGYLSFVFFVTIGILNVISAIFVDRMLKTHEQKKLDELNKRLRDDATYDIHASHFVKRVLEHEDSGYSIAGRMSENVEEILSLEIPRRVVQKVARTDAEAIQSLSALDIDPGDQFKLANILDAEHKGKVDVNSILSGLQRLRGTQRRSDVISVELVAIAIQSKLSKLYDEIHLMLTSRVVDDTSPHLRKNDDNDYDFLAWQCRRQCEL